MDKKVKNEVVKLDIMLPYGVAIGALLGILIAFANNNVAFLVYGIIIGLFTGVGIASYLYRKSNQNKKK
ncbi:MAG: hypothetical protein IJN03_00825 [Bacilli bacterium]|nr:hypothetical protein [Bacilli bacterium]